MRPVYWFEEVKQELVKHIGASAWRIGQLKNLEVPSAPGFILSSLFTQNFLDETQNAKLKSQLLKQLVLLEKNTGKTIDSPKNPLILSVYPSHYDQLNDGIDPMINIGLNDETVEGLAESYHRPKFAYLTYLRFVVDFSESILDVDFPFIDQQVKRFMTLKRVDQLVDLEIKDILELCSIIKNLPTQLKNVEFPQSTLDQLELIVMKKVALWQRDSLIDYRRSVEMDSKLGLSLIVREQKFSNLGEDSADVKILTRDPNSGEKKLIVSGFRNWQRYSKIPFKQTYSKFTQFVDGSLLSQVNEMVQVLETYFCNGLELNLIIEDNKIFVNQVKPLKKTPRAELKIALDLTSDINKDLKHTSQSIVLSNLKKYFNPEVEISSHSVKICDLESLSNRSLVGHLTTDSRLKLESRILVIDKDGSSFATDLNDTKGLLVLNKHYCFKTIAEARKRMIPVFACSEMVIQDGVIKTNSGITIRNGAEVTLAHKADAMYAGALPFSQVKPGQDLVEFNKELNDNLSSSFGLACQTRKDITLSEGFGSKDVQMLLSDVTNSEELAIIRSELSFLINQNPNCKLRFATSHHQILNNPELVLNQISALLEASINNNACNKVTLVLDAPVDNLGYKTIIDWIERSIKQEHYAEMQKIKLVTTVNSCGNLDFESVDKRVDGVLINIDRILEQSFLSGSLKGSLLAENVLPALHISNVKNKGFLKDFLHTKLTKRPKNLKCELSSCTMLNHKWMEMVKDMDFDLILSCKDSLTPNKILLLQSE